MKLVSVAFVGRMIALALPLAVAPRAMAANVSYQWAGNSAQQVEWNADAANWESRAEGVKDWTPNSMPPSAGDPYSLTFSKQANQTVKVRVSTPMPVIKRFSTTFGSGSTSIVEIVEGGAITNQERTVIGQSGKQKAEDVTDQVSIIHVNGGSFYGGSSAGGSYVSPSLGSGCSAKLVLDAGSVYLGGLTLINSEVVVNGGLLEGSLTIGSELAATGTSPEPRARAVFTMTGGLFKGSVSGNGGEFHLKGGTVETKNLDMRAAGCANGISTNRYFISGGSMTMSDPWRLCYCDTGNNPFKGRTEVFLSGGQLTLKGSNALAFQNPGYDAETYSQVEISGGTFNASGTITCASTNGAVFRVVGGAPAVTNAYFYATESQVGRILTEGVVAQGALAPIVWTANSVGNYGGRLWGPSVIRPQGGVQFATVSNFVQHSRAVSNSYLFKYDFADMNVSAMTNGLWRVDSRQIDTVGTFGWVLREEEEIPNGFTGAKPWGWFRLPRLRTASLKSAEVTMELEPKAKSASQLLAGIREAGFAVKENAVLPSGNLSVTFELPKDRILDRSDENRVFFDFTEYRRPCDACSGLRTTNAVVRAFSCQKRLNGLLLLLK